MSKVTPMGFTFSAQTPKLRKYWPVLSEAARQRIIEQFMALKASMEAFEAQMQAVSDAAKLSTAALKRRIQGHGSNWITKDDKSATTNGPPKSQHGYIVDVIASHPGPQGGHTLLIPRKVESIEDAIDRLSLSSTWTRSQVRELGRTFTLSGQFSHAEIPGLMDGVMRSWANGWPLDPHMIVQFARAYRANPRKPT